MIQMTPRRKLALFGIIITAIAGLISGFEMVGETAVLPKVIALFALGFGSGASLVAFLKKKS